MKVSFNLLLVILVGTVLGSPLEEANDFESAPLKTRCNKIDKTDRLPLDVDGARGCIDGWRNGQEPSSFEVLELMRSRKGSGLVHTSMVNSCHARTSTGFEIPICGKIRTVVGIIAKIASMRQSTRASQAYCV